MESLDKETGGYSDEVQRYGSFGTARAARYSELSLLYIVITTLNAKINTTPTLDNFDCNHSLGNNTDSTHWAIYKVYIQKMKACLIAHDMYPS